MERTTGHRCIIALVAIAAILGGPARADEAAIGFDASRFWNMFGGIGNFGWQFTTRSEIQVTALGVYDNPGIFGGGFPGDGLLDSHRVGLWDLANPSAPLVSALVPAGTVAPLSDGFRYVDTGPVTLAANRDYVIAALYPSNLPGTQDLTVGSVNNPDFALTVSPEIAFGGYRFNNATTFSFPDSYQPGLQLDFGPNFRIATVPEPSSLALMALGLLGVLACTMRPIRHLAAKA